MEREMPGAANFLPAARVFERFKGPNQGADMFQGAQNDSGQARLSRIVSAVSEVTVPIMRQYVAAVVFLVIGHTMAVADFDARYNFAAPIKRVAFVVGNADYVNAEPLPGSLSDSNEMKKKLEASGFSVTLAQNLASRDAFLGKFLDFLDQIEPGSFVVFYFSGHGFTYGGESYLAPLNFPKKVASTAVFTTFISVSALQERINFKDPGVLVMFLDACRNIGGFIDASAGGPADIEKGLASLATSKNNLIAYATAPGEISLGSATGGLSRYTEALTAHIPAIDVEFEQAHKEVIGDVRQSTDDKQSPWLSASSTLDIYFNPSEAKLKKFLEAWEAAQYEDTSAAVKRYLNLFGLGPYAAAAKKWLAEKPQASSFTQVSATQIDALWASARNATAVTSQITGPFGLPRAVSNSQPSIPMSTNERVRSAPRVVADVLAGTQTAVILESTVAHSKPSVAADVVANLGAGSRIAVSGFEEKEDGRVWLKARSKDGSEEVYVQVPKTAGIQDITLGKALREFDLTAESAYAAEFADSAAIDEALRDLKGGAGGVSWVSISVPKLDSHGKAFAEKAALVLDSRAAHGAYLLARTIPKDRITVLNGADFSGENPRVRIFGN
jgi:uncharacterized caspase-like protein